MRISTKQFYDNIINSLPAKLGELVKSQEQISSGKKINKLSDDPVALPRLLDFGTIISKTDQFMRNIDFGRGFLESGDAVLDEADNILNRAKELALAMGNGTISATIRNNAGTEVQGIIDQMVSISNTMVGDRHIFSGYAAHGKYKGTDISGSFPAGVTITTGSNDTLKLSVDGVSIPAVTIAQAIYATGAALATELQTKLTAAGANVTASWSTDHLEIVSQGNGSASTVTIDTTTSTADTILGLETGTSYTGVNPFATDGEYLGGSNNVGIEINVGQVVNITKAGDSVFKSAGGIDVFSTLTNLKIALQGNDTNGIRGALGLLDSSRNQVNSARVELGSNLNRFISTKSNLESFKLSITGLKSQIEDVDITQAITRMTQQQNTLEASLLSASKIMQISLLDFLR